MDTKRYTFEDKEEIILADISFLFFREKRHRWGGENHEIGRKSWEGE